ncbi:Imm47 family immunity protein [Paenibacillus macerans]|nr:Imm47 family immunity protein [Paenibacillus macerans]MEC0329883.1 Imm47 family immunity protein [Paenibacillus macerans]
MGLVVGRFSGVLPYLVPNEYNYKDFIDYVREFSRENWEAGEKYFYGHKL